MKKIALLAVSAVFVFASCSKDGGQSGAGDSKTIEFRSVVEKGRASVIGSTAQLESFFVLGQKDGDTDFSFLSAAVYKDAAGWAYAPKKMWPVDNSDIYFYAYSPINSAITASMVTDGTDASFDYTVPVDQSVLNTACDLLVASESGDGVTNAATPVSFTFDHALSAVTFSALNKNAAATGLIYTISKIEITNLGAASTYTYGAGWDAPAAQTLTYKAGVPASGVAVNPVGAAGASVKLLSANDVMMVLPQTPLATSKVKITYSLTNGDQVIYANATEELALPAAFEFEAGSRYNFKFTFDASNAIVFDVADVNGWNDTDEDL